MQNRGQVTIFIIIAIVIVAAVGIFFVMNQGIFAEKIPASMEPIYNTFLTCVEDEVLVGVSVLESQGGYIELPDFEQGSEYMPFSSQLNFLGNPIPYWYYVSGNNIPKEQIPSRGDMEEQLENFVEEKIKTCIFENYYDEGFIISLSEPKAKINIKESEIQINLDMDLDIERGEESVSVKNHKVVSSSELGRLYDSAIKVYEQEQKSLFLENYGVDVLRLYAPVDGVELSCAPLTWNAEEVLDELEDAIETNTLSLKSSGDDDDYFVVDNLNVKEDVRFINSKQWPRGFEVVPSESSVLISSPVGNQQGLGALGFCYVPYHFVYNMRYPVLVQVYSGEEIFQFPLAVVIQGNKPREALDATAVAAEDSQICEYRNTNVKVNTYDSFSNSVEADISFECFGSRCDIGKTIGGSLEGEFPQCANGFVVAKAEGYENAKFVYSTTSGGSVDIIMDKIYEVEIDLKLDSTNYNGNAVISFVSDSGSRTIVYPDQKIVELSEDQYEIQVSVYEDSDLKLDATSKEQCVEIPRSGFGGLFGLTSEKCFDVEFPAQIVSNVLVGGGKQNYYVLESELQNSNLIEINARGLPTPKTIEELQKNYGLFETKDLDVMFK
jgi:hypothetical protein